MPEPYASELLRADINWSEEDIQRNSERYAVRFQDIRSGFARPRVRTAIDDHSEFTALVEAEGVVFNVRCRVDLNLTIIAAKVATKDDQTAYRKALSQPT